MIRLALVVDGAGDQHGAMKNQAELAAASLVVRAADHDTDIQLPWVPFVACHCRACEEMVRERTKRAG